MQRANLQSELYSRFTLFLHDATMRHLKNPEEQGVSTTVRTSQFFQRLACLLLDYLLTKVPVPTSKDFKLLFK